MNCNFSVVETIHNVIFSHQKYWKCFQTEFLISPTYKAVPSYSFNEVLLTVFPTSNCCPIQDVTKIDEFSVLQHLISGENII